MGRSLCRSLSWHLEDAADGIHFFYAYFSNYRSILGSPARNVWNGSISYRSSSNHKRD